MLRQLLQRQLPTAMLPHQVRNLRRRQHTEVCLRLAILRRHLASSHLRHLHTHPRQLSKRLLQQRHLHLEALPRAPLVLVLHQAALLRVYRQGQTRGQVPLRRQLLHLLRPSTVS